MFDLLTGAVYARKGGKSASALRVGLLAEKVPALTRYVRELVSIENEDEVELLEVTTERIALLVATVPEAAEASACWRRRRSPRSSSRPRSPASCAATRRASTRPAAPSPVLGSATRPSPRRR